MTFRQSDCFHSGFFFLGSKIGIHHLLHILIFVGFHQRTSDFTGKLIFFSTNYLAFPINGFPNDLDLVLNSLMSQQRMNVKEKKKTKNVVEIRLLWLLLFLNHFCRFGWFFSSILLWKILQMTFKDDSIEKCVACPIWCPHSRETTSFFFYNVHIHSNHEC